MMGLDVPITKVLQDAFPFTQEDGIDRTFAAHRDGTANSVTGSFSVVGPTATIFAVMPVVAVVLRLVFRRWRESVFLALAASAQALVFPVTTLVMSPQRPRVPKLDRRWPIVTVLLLVPLGVAVSRLYRGMHHPSNVVAAFVNGGLCVLLAARTVQFGRLPEGPARRLDRRHGAAACPAVRV